MNQGVTTHQLGAALASGAASALGAALRRTGYCQAPTSTAAAASALGSHVTTEHWEPLLGVRPSPLTALLSLGLAVERGEVAGLVGEATVSRLVSLEILSVETVEGSGEAGGEKGRERVRSRIHVDRFEDLLIACDTAASLSEPDYVMGVVPAAMTLARLTPRTKAGAALDVGCGSGLQALLAARHCKFVVGVDINPRAVAFTAFNAALNGLANVECLEGDFFAPVAQRRFDLIVSNPPFVISPEEGHLFRDSWIAGDGVSRRMVAEAANHLTAGGCACVLVNWAMDGDGHWSRALCGWSQHLGCDAVLLHYRTEDPLAYAASWSSIDVDETREARAGVLQHWLEYYSAQGVRRIGTGGVVLRKRQGANWVCALEMPGAPGEAAGAQLARLIEQRDQLDGATDEQLLSAALRPAEGFRIEDRLVYHGDQYAVAGANASIEGGLSVAAAVDPMAIQILLRLGGGTTVEEALGDAVEAGGELYQTLEAPTLATVRRLLAAGMLSWPAELDPVEQAAALPDLRGGVELTAVLAGDAA